MTENPNLRITHSQVHVEWNIEGFFNLPKEVNYYLSSPYFSLSRSKWFLRIYPNGLTNIEDWIGLFLQKEASSEECFVAFKMGIKYGDGLVFHIPNKKYSFSMENRVAGSCRFIKIRSLRCTKDMLALDGSLKVFCAACIENTKEVQSQTISPIVIPNLVKDLERLYLDRQYSDIIIKVKNKEIVAHKCIIASRSKVFAAMFEHDMAEKNSGTVELEDTDPDTFEDFMLYMYTGKLDVVLSSNALSLYKLADKYDVEELKKECVQCMTRELSVDSFCDVVHLATMHGESDLLNSATTFFTTNMKTILQTTKWLGFLAENLALGNELILKAINKLHN